MAAPFDWDKLRIFHAAAEAGSFTHAAQSLRLSQSAISRQVSALEQEIGSSLFQRHARGLILTEQGEILYRSTSNVLLELKNVHALLTENQDTPSGKLCVTTTFGMGLGWLIEFMPEFKQLYPDIHVQMRLDDVEVNLSMRHADCAIRLHPPQQPDLIQRKLFTVHMHVYASKGYLERYGAPESFKDLDNHRIISFGTPVPVYLSSLNWLETVGYTHGAHRVAALQVNNLAVIKSAVRQGLGIAVLPDYIIKEDSDFVRLFPNCEDIPSFDTFFCYPESLKNSAKLHAFRDFIFTKAKKWPF